MKTTMMQLIKRTVTLLIIALSGLAISEPLTKYMNISYNLLSPITLNEPVAVDVLIENQMSYAITIDLGIQCKGGFRFNIITPDNKQIDLPASINLGSSGLVYLKPKEKHSQRLILNEWYPFDSPGKYHILIAMDSPIIIGETHLPYINSINENDHQRDEAALDLTILPRDEAVLKNKCETLFRRLREGNEFSERTPFAEELSYINDPIAIPFLKKLAEEMEEGYAIRGLMRIGTDEAMEAMIAVTQSEYDKDAAASAKDILRKKLDNIKDPNIQKKVNDAINH